ncbi:YoaK family protein [Sphingomonas qilianensis]|uniref:DUF1275 family protein n=1 Tax=Sphingomonas qilianensis TaxID=1736690 RepID=A0ABU9XN21_9SPHN
MTTIDHPERVLAVLLSAAAGFVDAVGFLASGGYFMSFMSGNSTRLGVGLAAGTAAAAIAGGLILLFVGGVTAGSLIGRVARAQRRGWVLATIAALLALAAMLGDAGLLWPACAAMAIAMGMENTVFEQDGEVRIGLTYMTGRLVKVGQRLAAALAGEDRWGWVPHALLWSGLITGGAAGAACFAAWGLDALWIVAAGMALLVLLVTLGPLRARESLA